MQINKNSNVTSEMTRFIDETTYADLPVDVIDLAKRCILDGLAVMLAGSTEVAPSILRKVAGQIGGVKEARTVGGDSIAVPVHLAAQINGMSGHALDWDDTALSDQKDRSVLIHPTIPPLSACLALAEKMEVSAQEFLMAFILGFEIEVKIAESINPEHFAGGRGFHSTGTIGVFGATVAACKILNLNSKQISNSLAIASTLSCGVGSNHGTMSKPLNMARASESGVMAATLASSGIDGPMNSLERGRGFFEAFGGGFDPKKIIGRLGMPYAISYPGSSVKPYPSGVVGHPGMDAMKKLVEQHDIRPEDVERIQVLTGENVITPGPLRILHANNALEAKFCVPFQMASIVLRRKAGLLEFTDEFVESSECQLMQKRVSAELDPEIVALGKGRIVFKILLTTKDGTTYTQVSEPVYRGGPDNPLTWGELEEKFKNCSQHLLTEDDACVVIDLIKNFEELSSMKTLLNKVVS